MAKEAQKYIRVPVKLTHDLKAWLDKEHKRTGISQNTLLVLGLETLIKERDLYFSNAELVEKVNQLEAKLNLLINKGEKVND